MPVLIWPGDLRRRPFVLQQDRAGLHRPQCRRRIRLGLAVERTSRRSVGSAGDSSPGAGGAAGVSGTEYRLRRHEADYSLDGRKGRPAAPRAAPSPVSSVPPPTSRRAGKQNFLAAQACARVEAEAESRLAKVRQLAEKRAAHPRPARCRRPGWPP
ncbi:MAG: hypothetical protein MZW92_20530 [Comamonadaceae bacterium]|nr:hypothetical protein [Comamonadaceae bacterium]